MLSVTAIGNDVAQPDSKSYGALLGGTLLLAGDQQGYGPLGLSLSLGMLLARAEAPGTEVTFLAPMVLVGFDFVPPWMLYCWLIDDDCPHHVDALKR